MFLKRNSENREYTCLVYCFIAGWTRFTFLNWTECEEVYKAERYLFVFVFFLSRYITIQYSYSLCILFFLFPPNYGLVAFRFSLTWSLSYIARFLGGQWLEWDFIAIHLSCQEQREKKKKGIKIKREKNFFFLPLTPQLDYYYLCIDYIYIFFHQLLMKSFLDARLIRTMIRQQFTSVTVIYS